MVNTSPLYLREGSSITYVISIKIICSQWRIFQYLENSGIDLIYIIHHALCIKINLTEVTNHVCL